MREAKGLRCRFRNSVLKVLHKKGSPKHKLYFFEQKTITSHLQLYRSGDLHLSLNHGLTNSCYCVSWFQPAVLVLTVTLLVSRALLTLSIVQQQLKSVLVLMGFIGASRHKKGLLLAVQVSQGQGTLT